MKYARSSSTLFIWLLFTCIPVWCAENQQPLRQPLMVEMSQAGLVAYSTDAAASSPAGAQENNRTCWEKHGNTVKSAAAGFGVGAGITLGAPAVVVGFIRIIASGIANS